jgi:hypothetical protein
VTVVKIELTQRERDVIDGLHADPADPLAVLTLILASPTAMSKYLGVDRTVFLAVKMASLLKKEEFKEFMSTVEEMVQFSPAGPDGVPEIMK